MQGTLSLQLCGVLEAQHPFLFSAVLQTALSQAHASLWPKTPLHGFRGSHLSPTRNLCWLKRRSTVSKALYRSACARSYAPCVVANPLLYTPLLICRHRRSNHNLTTCFY